MPGYIEDRWLNKTPDPVTGRRKRTAYWGKGKRYKVKGIPGVPDRSFHASGEAKEWLKAAATDTGRGLFVDPRNGDLTLREYVEKHWWPSVRYPPSTREAMEARIWGHILPHLGKTPLNRIGTDEVNAWTVAAEKEIATSNVRTCWRHLSTILQAAFEAKRIAVNPCRGNSTARPPAKPKQKARRLETPSIPVVRQALPPRSRVLLDVGLGAGLRQGEAFGLSPDDLGTDTIHVCRQVMRVNSRLCFGPPKGNEERDAPLAPELAALIKEHSGAFPPVEVELPWVDPDLPNMPWGDRPKVKVVLVSTTTWKRAINRSHWNPKSWKTALEAAELVKKGEDSHLFEPSREWGFQVARHTFASVMLANGVTPVTLAKWLGHSDPAFTLRTYTHFMPEYADRGIAAIGEWLTQLRT